METGSINTASKLRADPRRRTRSDLRARPRLCILFANMFADEKVLDTIAHLAPGITYWIVPVALMPLSLFVAFIQTFVFVLLSQLYISEVSHPPHDSHAHVPDDGMEIVAPVLT